MTYVITQSCCNDSSCIEVCPVDCIHPGPDADGFGSAEMLYIDPGECIDCGACEEACPVSAIYSEFDLPEHLQGYAAINADFFAWTGGSPEAQAPPSEGPKIEGEGPLRVAVVGAGPAGWFVAEELTGTRRTELEVTVLDRLATPYGLVRYGVAPDHLHTKDVTEMFARTAAHRRTAVRLNVEVGRDVTHEQLLAHHHAVVYATGASVGRSLGIAGEDLPGSAAAADFVGWYNGHPDHAGHHFDLSTSRAVLIGNGNVALDIARLLLSEEPRLLASDMAPHAVAALAASTIEEVVVVARRGAEHAAFTSPELLALVDDPDIDVVVEAAEIEGIAERVEALHDGARDAGSYAAHRKAELLARLAAEPQSGGARRLVLRFGLTPAEIVGDDAVSAVLFAGVDGAEARIETGLVLRATGYLSTAIDGVPLDVVAGRFRHDAGRVLDPETGDAVPGSYTAGWVKRGPSGVIGTNRLCAAETVRTLLDDHHGGRLAAPSGDAAAFDALLAETGVQVVSADDWRRLDAHETSTGKEQGRPRHKVVDRDEQLRLALA